MTFDKFDICEAYWCFYAEWGYDEYTCPGEIEKYI
jgi:hypothetical protein